MSMYRLAARHDARRKTGNEGSNGAGRDAGVGAGPRARRAAGTATAALVCALFLGACVATPVSPVRPVGPGPVQPQPDTRVEGSWAPGDGASIATFQNGAFTNRASDTGQPFTAGGRYAYASANEVRITYTSVVRQEQVNVNCLVVAPTQMNCTNNAGAQFSLFRRA